MDELLKLGTGQVCPKLVIERIEDTTKEYLKILKEKEYKEKKEDLEFLQNRIIKLSKELED